MLITDTAVRETAATLAQSLGPGWTLDSEAPADGAAHLVHSDGRAISFRPIFGGASVQLWITGNADPDLPDSATPAQQAAREAQLLARLPEGHRYNKATTLVTEGDEEPAVIILSTLEEHLLPAFQYKPRYVGHQPWKDLFDNALAAVAAESDTPQATGGSTETEPDAAPEPAAENESEPGVPESAMAPRPEATDTTAAAERGPAESEPRSEAAEPEVAEEPVPASDEGGAVPEGAPTEKASSRREPAATRRPRKRTSKRRADSDAA